MADMADIATAAVTTQESSANGDGSQRPRRVRTSRPKVKTGCNNCKQRRIKCDERRPSCTQCERSRKQCQGYPPPPRTRVFEEVRIAPRPVSHSQISPSFGSSPSSNSTLSSSSKSVAPVSPAPSFNSISPTRFPIAVVQGPKLHATPILAATLVRNLTPPVTPISRTASLFVATPSLTHQPGAGLPFDPKEGQYFQLFRERTVSELSGFFDFSFWTCGILQECHSSEAVRYAVVALGALYKTLDKVSESPPGSPGENLARIDHAIRHWEVAFRYYSLALSAMVSSTSESHDSQRTSLMATVLLACFDSFIGDHQQAIVQIQSGLRLLEKLRVESRRVMASKPEEPVEGDLIQMFTRLAIQAKSYDMAFHFPHPYVVQLTPQTDEGNSSSTNGGDPTSTFQKPIPPVFQSLSEARLSWDTLCEKAMRFTETMFRYTNSSSPMGILPSSLKQYGAGFKNEIDNWSRAFEPILASRTAPNISSQEKTAISVLKMFQIMGQILFLMTFSDRESQFDLFLPHFRAITSLATEVVGDEERRAAAKRCPDPNFCRHRTAQADFPGAYETRQFAAKHIKPSFSADLGIVPPLYVVATKCRDPPTRRQAIQLLRSSSRREGMWDSELAAHIGMWITAIEEEGLHPDETRPMSSSPVASSSTASTFQSPTQQQAGSVNYGGQVANSLRAEGDGANGTQQPISEEKRVMIRAVDFNLRDRNATVKCGTRDLIPGMHDAKMRTRKIAW